jgi:hypothetical protein
MRRGESIDSVRLRQGVQTRKEAFIRCGLKRLQVGLAAALWIYVATVVGAFVSYGASLEQPLKILIVPGVLVLIWLLHFQYHRASFLLLAVGTAATLLSSLLHLYFEPFFLASCVARVAVIVTAAQIYARMQDPIFSRS